MSNTKWIKLIEALNTLIPKHQLDAFAGGCVYYTFIWQALIDEPCRLSPEPLITPADIVDRKLIRDGSIISGPCLLQDLWEIAIPIAEKSSTFYPVGNPNVAERDLLPQLEQFLIDLDGVAKFPYEVTKHYSVKVHSKSGSTITTWRFITFYGYARSESGLIC